jgi:hypothetical protein
VQAEGQARNPLSDISKIDDCCLDPKSVGQLACPLLPQPGRRQDQDSVGQTSCLQLTDDEARLNSLPQANIVGQEHSGSETSNDRQRRFQLVGHQIDTGRTCGAETAGRCVDC